MKKRILIALLALGLLAGCGPNRTPAASSSDAESPYEEVVLFVPNDTADGLDEKNVQVEKTDTPAQEMDEIVQALIGENALPLGTEVKKVSISSGENPKMAVDLNRRFADALLGQGSAGETVTMAALVNTIFTYYAPSELTLTAEGKPIETGHNIYEEAFTEPMTLDSSAQ